MRGEREEFYRRQDRLGYGNEREFRGEPSAQYRERWPGQRSGRPGDAYGYRQVAASGDMRAVNAVTTTGRSFDKAPGSVVVPATSRSMRNGFRNIKGATVGLKASDSSKA